MALVLIIAFCLQDDPEVKMLVLLGEVGGVEEYKVCEALKSRRINKPMVAWCIGTCGDMFSTDVQVKGSTIFTSICFCSTLLWTSPLTGNVKSIA